MVNDVSNIERKIKKLKEMFTGFSPEDKIKHLLDLGRALSPYPDERKTPERLVPGCQSMLYLFSRLDGGYVFFEASADALISAGLAALFIFIYDGETPETILKTPPSFLTDLGILSTLSPSRSNGMAHIHQRIKKDCLKYLLSTMKSVELNRDLR